MKRCYLVLATLFLTALWLSGCIMSVSPSTTSAITLKVGESQTFKVNGAMNGPYEWYKNDTLLSAVTGSSYTYIAEVLDKGTNKFRVQTKDQLQNKILTKEWTVEVYYNMPPIANAGPDQNVYFGNNVYLDGSASSDPEAHSLVYLWSMVSRPAGSSAELVGQYTVNPSFTPDKEGAYTIRLLVNDGDQNSAADAVVINVGTSFFPPTANAGPDQRVLFGNAVLLDGSASSDPEHDPLTYQWSMETMPGGSGAVLDDPTSMTPSFMPDRKGVYTIRLVVNDGTFNSGIDTVIIEVFNTAPVAHAGDDITISDVGGTANLDGSLSTDPDGTPLTYTWTVINRPSGSNAQIVNPTSDKPTFTPDKKGGYGIKLGVTDGDLTAEDTVTVNCSNHTPVAVAGNPITIPFTQTAQLNGSASYDPDGDPLTYAWTITGRPDGSTATLSSSTAVTPTFTPDKKGVYTFSLTVKDDENISSVPDTVTVTTTNHVPVAEAGIDVNILNKHLVQLSGSGSDLDGDTLTYAWTVVTAPAGSTASFSNPAIYNPTFTPDRKGIYTLGLVVYDGEDYSLQDTVQINATNNTPVAEAGANQSVRFANRVVQLNGSGSSDLDPEDTLHYTWTLTTKPSGSTASISNPLTVNPVITLDVPGTYVISLVVDDGTVNSSVDTVTFTTPQATYTTGFEGGSLNDSAGNTWIPTSYGTMGPVGAYDAEAHSGSYSYRMKDCNNFLGDCGSGWHKLTNYSGRYIYSVSVWMVTPTYDKFPNLDAGLYDGETLQIHYDGNNFYTQYSWTANKIVTNLNFRLNGNGGATWLPHAMWFDDISVTVWE